MLRNCKLVMPAGCFREYAGRRRHAVAAVGLQGQAQKTPVACHKAGGRIVMRVCRDKVPS
jgi:hypothetical protein